MYFMPFPTSAPVDEALQWSKIGTIGTLVSAIFSFIAIVISLIAFFYPRRIKVDARITTSILVSQTPGIKSITAYTITVRNLGARAVTINNVYLNFGGKRQGNIFVGKLNENTPLQFITITFPVRLDQGESFEYHLLKDKLDYALANLAKEPKDSKLNLVVDEVTKGQRYIPTKLTLRSFIDGQE